MQSRTFVPGIGGKETLIRDMPFAVAAYWITRVISVLDEHHVCVDLVTRQFGKWPCVFFLEPSEAKTYLPEWYSIWS